METVRSSSAFSARILGSHLASASVASLSAAAIRSARAIASARWGLGSGPMRATADWAPEAWGAAPAATVPPGGGNSTLLRACPAG